MTTSAPGATVSDACTTRLVKRQLRLLPEVANPPARSVSSVQTHSTLTRRDCIEHLTDILTRTCSTKTAPKMPRKKALIIGINYAGTENALNGCINDAMNVRDFLVNERIPSTGRGADDHHDGRTRERGHRAVPDPR